jgi:hypothetical protein
MTAEQIVRGLSTDRHTSPRVFAIQERVGECYGNLRRLKIGQTVVDTVEILRVGEIEQIEIATELNPLVRHARLAAREPRLRATLPHSKKGL